MFALLSVLPIIIVIVLLLAFKQRSSTSLLAGWAVAVLLALTLWGLEPIHLAAWTVFGFLQAFPILIIILGSVFLLNVLTELNFIKTIGNGFKGISNDRRIQILLISWFFGAFLEGAAGFGTPGAIAAPLLVGLGVPTFFAAVASLIMESTPVLFGAVGVPTTAGFASISPVLVAQYGQEMTDAIFSQMNYRLAFSNMFIGTFVPFMMIAAVVSRDGRKQGIKEALPMIPLTLIAGLGFVIPQWLISHVGPQLPSLAGGLVGLVIFLFFVKRGIFVPKDIYRFQDDPIMEDKAEDKTGISLLYAWSPYVLVIAVILLTRLPWFHLGPLFNPTPQMIQVHNILGISGINWNFNPLWNPGIFPFIPIGMIYLLIRKADKSTWRKLCVGTIVQLKYPTIALFFAVALVQIMTNTNFSNPDGNLGSMLSEIAQFLSSHLGAIYLFVAPFIGILGAFVSGSHTVSNVMFMGLQVEAAQLLNLPITLALVAQASGGAVGNMIAIHNIISIVATTGHTGKEGELIRATLVPMLIYTVVVAITFYILLAIGLPWIA